MDWITWTVEAVGICILCVWVAVPAREFVALYHHLMASGSSPEEKTGSPPKPLIVV